MATLLIKEIHVTSRGGYNVIITGVVPTDHDCIVGTIDTPGQGVISGCWNLSGYLRSGTNSCNLDMNNSLLAELSDLLKQLGAS